MAWWTGSGRVPGGGRRSGRRLFTRTAQAASWPARAVGGVAGGESGKGLDGLTLAVVHVEDGNELGDGEDVGDLAGQVEQLQLGPPVGRRGVAAHQLADAGGVDGGDGEHV